MSAAESGSDTRRRVDEGGTLSRRERAIDDLLSNLHLEVVELRARGSMSVVCEAPQGILQGTGHAVGLAALETTARDQVLDGCLQRRELFLRRRRVGGVNPHDGVSVAGRVVPESSHLACVVDRVGRALGSTKSIHPVTRHVCVISRAIA